MYVFKVLIISVLCGSKFIRRESARSSTSNGVFLTEKQMGYS